LTEKGKENFLSQIYAITKYNLDDICNSNIKINDPCCIISKNKIEHHDVIEIMDVYAAVGLLLGVESIRIMEHQDLYRMCAYMAIGEKKDKAAKTEGRKYQFGDVPKLDILDIIESQNTFGFYDFIEISKQIGKSPREIAVDLKKKRCTGDKCKKYRGYTYNKQKKIIASTKMISSFYKFHNGLDRDTKERLLVISGSILHVLGTTYTDDVDIYYYGETESQNKMDGLITKFQINPKFEYTIVHDGRIIQAKKPSSYVYKWATELWPQLVGKKHLTEVMADPAYSFYFMGIKMIGVDMIIERLLSRASPSAFVDLIMLNKINGFESDPCFPNLTIRQGKIMIYDNKMIEKKLRTVCNYFYHWHNMHMCLNKLKKKIPRCTELPHHIYKKIPEKNPHTSLITYYNNSTMKYYIKKYLLGEKILDIGAGRLRDMFFYDRIGIKHLVAIEPSSISLEEGKKAHKKRHLKIRLDAVQGYGDEDWTKADVYKVVLNNKPYKHILLKFTIHYMIKKIDTLLNNIKQVADDTTIVVGLLDGNLIEQKIADTGRYEVFVGDEPLYGIYRMDPDGAYKKIMVYFKGVYGVESGSIEYLVDINDVVDKFKNAGFRLIDNKSLVEVEHPTLNKIRGKFSDAQRKVSELHRVLVFRKGNTGGYYQKYLKYKVKYINLKKI